jgi:hypothetical protein
MFISPCCANSHHDATCHDAMQHMESKSHAVWTSTLQKHELNKLVFFISYPALGIMLQQWKID